METKTRKVRKRVKLKKRSFFSREITNLKDEMRRITSVEIIIFAIFIFIFIIGIFHKVIYNYFAGL